MRLYLILFLAVVNEGTSSHRPLEESPCLMENMTAFCQDKSLQEIPLGLHPNVKTLDLSKNELQNITEYPLAFYLSIEALDLSDNKISFVQPGAFTCMSNLKRIHFSGNYLDRYMQYRVSGIGLLPHVQYLDLSRNSLYTDMTGHFLEEAPSLQYLLLPDNSITMITPNTFHGSPLLKEVDLHNNIVMDIEDGSFEHLKYLTKLNLAMNSISCVSDFNLRQLHSLNLSKNSIEMFYTSDSDEEFKLEYLDLSDNKLFRFPVLPRVNNLVSIDLSQNFIHFGAETSQDDNEWLNDPFQMEIESEKMKNASTVILPKLTYLDLSYNEIKYIPEDFFITLPSLRFLNLSRNCLEVFSVDQTVTLNSLVILDLSGNTLRNISLSPTSFYSLQQLYLQNNLLQTLESTIFQGLRSILTIDLQNNNISLCSPSLGIVKQRTEEEDGCVSFFNIPTLQHLNLRQNMMPYVPQFAFMGTSLAFLDLSMNQGLTIRPKALSGLENYLEMLHVEENSLQILNVDLHYFVQMKYLNLSGNQLTWLPMWTKDCSLETLDLSHNSFSNLQLCNIPVLEKTLKTLSLHGNPLSCCENYWITHMIQRSLVTIKALDLTMCNYSKGLENQKETLVGHIRSDICEKEDLNKINIITILTLVLVLSVIVIGLTSFCCYRRQKFSQQFKA
ncbi:transforming growth factor beta activator LRRC32 [Bombina bombina]|uniref:transforming growth factor beta activator LRRC32 n=1 Tax=Bombina bombina TaxID=8345 RepID=UPI00235ADD68|nr:transforming growth factor beta activator LRRC32 [Bombina bombina]